jgi:hypothetical protein
LPLENTAPGTKPSIIIHKYYLRLTPRASIGTGAFLVVGRDGFAPIFVRLFDTLHPKFRESFAWQREPDVGIIHI